MLVVPKDVFGLIINHLDDPEDLMRITKCVPNNLRPLTFKRAFEIKFPYTLLSDIPKKRLRNGNDYSSGYLYMSSCLINMPKAHIEYIPFMINRQKNKSLIIPVNLTPSEDVFLHFYYEFKKEYFDCLNNDKCVMPPTTTRFFIRDFMRRLLIGLKRSDYCNSNSYRLLSLTRRHLFSQMLVKYSLIPLIPRVADCIVDISGIDYYVQSCYKYWCTRQEGENFEIIECDKNIDFCGTVPREFSFPKYHPNYFVDIMTKNKLVPVDLKHPEVAKQIEEQKNKSHITIKTTIPPNQLDAFIDTSIVVNIDNIDFDRVYWNPNSNGDYVFR